MLCAFFSPLLRHTLTDNALEMVKQIVTRFVWHIKEANEQKDKQTKRSDVLGVFRWLFEVSSCLV